MSLLLSCIQRLHQVVLAFIVLLLTRWHYIQMERFHVKRLQFLSPFLLVCLCKHKYEHSNSFFLIFTKRNFPLSDLNRGQLFNIRGLVLFAIIEFLDVRRFLSIRPSFLEILLEFSELMTLHELCIARGICSIFLKAYLTFLFTCSFLRLFTFNYLGEVFWYNQGQQVPTWDRETIVLDEF